MSKLWYLPEPDEKIQARFPDIFNRRFDASTIRAGLCEPPSQDRRHVFDFEDGIRMIASVDYDTASNTGSRLHLSFSINTDITTRFGPPGGPYGEKLMEAITARANEFSGGRVKTEVLISPKGVVHFLYVL